MGALTQYRATRPCLPSIRVVALTWPGDTRANPLAIGLAADIPYE